MTYLAYIRKSRLRPNERTVSIDEQQAKALAWAGQSGVELEWFIDVDQSGRTEARAEWQRLLGRLPDPDVRGVVVYNYTKTHRNVRNYLRFYDEQIEPLNKELIDLSDPHLSLTNADGRMKATIIAAVAEHHANKTAELISASLHHVKHHQGRYIGALPFGTERDPDTGHLIPSTATYLYHPATGQARPDDGSIPDGWEVRRYYDALRHLYEIYAGDEMSYATLARRANAAGWRYNSRQNRGPLPFYKRGVQSIIRNAFLYASGLQPDGWTAQHEPILTPELCQQVQARAATRATTRDPRPATDRRIYLLTGLIYCGACGARLSGSTPNPGRPYVYYMHSIRGRCAQPATPAAALEAEVLSRLGPLLDANNLLDTLGHEIKALERSLATPTDAGQLAQHEAELERLIDLRISGLIDKQQFIRRHDPLMAKIERLKSPAAPVGKLTALYEKIQSITPADHTDQSKKRLIHSAINRIEVLNRKIIRLDWEPWVSELGGWGEGSSLEFNV